MLDFKKDIFYPILDILFPQPCVICRKKVYTEERFFPVCVDCNKYVKFNKGQKSLQGKAKIYFLSDYNDEIRAMVHSLKYEGITTLVKYLVEKIHKVFYKKIKENK